MDVRKILLSFILALFCFDLTSSAPVFSGLLKTTNSSTEYEADSPREVFVISSNATTYDISKNNSMNNLTNGELPSVLHGKTFKKIVGKVKSFKNKITGGGGGSNKVKNNKDGRKGIGGISVHRPVRPIKFGDNSTMDYIMFGWLGFLVVFGIIIGVVTNYTKKDEEEKTEKEKEEKDSKEIKEDVNKNEENEKEKRLERWILNKQNSNKNRNVIETTDL